MPRVLINAVVTLLHRIKAITHTGITIFIQLGKIDCFHVCACVCVRVRIINCLCLCTSATHFQEWFREWQTHFWFFFSLYFLLSTRTHVIIILSIYHTASDLPLSVLFLGSSLTLQFFFFLPLSHMCKLPCSGDTLISFFICYALFLFGCVWLPSPPLIYLYIWQGSCVTESVCECWDHYLCLCVCARTSVCVRGRSGQAIIAAAAVVVLQRIVGGVQTGWGLWRALGLSDRPKFIMLRPAQWRRDRLLSMIK